MLYINVLPMMTMQSLDYAERWFRDGLRESAHAGGFEILDVDVTLARKTLERMRLRDPKVSWLHIFVRAVALTLVRYPELHRMVAGNSKIHPKTVDICLSVGNDASVNPVLIVEDAGNKNINEIAAEVVRRVPEVLEENRKLRTNLRRWGWFLPFSVLRRAFIGFLFRRMSYRRKVSGTFQISCVPQVDICAPMIFNTAAALGIGRVRERVVAENGVPVVRTVVSLTCCLDHSVWNGLACAKFLNGLKDVLTSCEFASEAPVEAPVTQTSDCAVLV